MIVIAYYFIGSTAVKRILSSRTDRAKAYKGRATPVRYVWLNISPRSARMEQSFSPDAGKTWEVNWICELSRD
jgi:hypothetical protein